LKKLSFGKNFAIMITKSKNSAAPKTAPEDYSRLTDGWQFNFSRLNIRARRIIIEGYAFLAENPPEADEIYLLLLLGPDYLSLEVSGGLQGDRLLDFFSKQLGQPAAPPRIIVGSHEGEEGALSQVEWPFPLSGRAHIIRRVSEILGLPLPESAPGNP
jgi:hypothetical protein